MDRSLKERLVGASVLVALAVWLVPWVLDGQPPEAELRATPESAAERSTAVRTRTIRLDDQRGAFAPGGAADIPDTPSGPADGTGWLVQVGNFQDEENARRQADRLTGAGYSADLYPHTSAGGLTYRVRVGPQPSRESAEEVKSSLLARGFVTDGLFVTEGSVAPVVGDD